MSKEIVNKEVILEKLQKAKIELEEQISKLSEDEQGQLQGGFKQIDPSTDPGGSTNVWCDEKC